MAPRTGRFPKQRFVGLSPEQAEELRRIADEDTMSEAEVLRAAFAAYTKARRRRIKRTSES